MYSLEGAVLRVCVKEAESLVDILGWIDIVWSSVNCLCCQRGSRSEPEGVLV